MVNISELEQIPVSGESQPDICKEEKVIRTKFKREIEFQLDSGLNFLDSEKIFSFLRRRGLDDAKLTSEVYEPHFYGGATHIYKIGSRRMTYGDRIELIGFLRRTFPFIGLRGCKPAGIGLEYC